MANQRENRSRNKSNDAKGRVRRGKPKVCLFCVEHIAWVDYKDTNLLRRFMTDRGKIKARTNTGTCAQHQRDVAVAIKTARELVLLPYVVRTLAADKSGGRPGRGAGRGGDRRPAGEGAANGAAEAAAGTDDRTATADESASANGTDDLQEASTS
jgi:ribosomal protein S18